MHLLIAPNNNNKIKPLGIKEQTLSYLGVFKACSMPELSSLIRAQEALIERVGISLDLGSNRNVPNWVFYTPPKPLQDETPATTATVEDEWLDDRPSTS